MLRPYADADLEALATLHAVSRRHAYAGTLPPEAIERVTPQAMLEQWADRLAEPLPGRQIVVAESGGRLVGFAMTTVVADGGELNAIHVHPDHHGTGVAVALHDLAMDQLRDGGCAAAYLWVLVGNERAQAFYRRHGWVFDGTRDSHPIGGFDADILRYAKDLAPAR